MPRCSAETWTSYNPCPSSTIRLAASVAELLTCCLSFTHCKYQPSSFLLYKLHTHHILVCRNLLNNPLHCNCHLGWFAEWLHQKRKESAFHLVGKARCASPSDLKDTPVYDLGGKDLKCLEDDYVCSSTSVGQRPFSCPAKCSCSGTVVRCSRQKLTVFPKNIPLATTEL